MNWRTAFWTVWALEQFIKLALAATLAPFGDEAWYWQESRALDWSYSDLPVATAALIRLGETMFGHGVLPMRAPFLLLGALLPMILVHVGARLFGARAGWQSGLLTLALPLLATLGMFALPDVPLTVCGALALASIERAARTGSTRDWCLLGLALAGAWLSHYRAGMLLLAGLAFLAATPRGRGLWRDRGMWLAIAISLAGVAPLLAFNVEHHWSALGFQLVERNPWSFHADALVQPLEQAIVCTPLFYAALLWAAWRCARRAREGAPWDLLASCALVPLIGYFVLGCFADDTRLRLHWPLPGYLPLLIALPALANRWARPAGEPVPTTRRIVVLATTVLLAAGCAATYLYFALAAIPGGALALARFKAFPEHWVGWNEVAQETRSRLAQPQFSGSVLVADNFMLAAELDFALDGARTIYTLDHPINAKHGRAPQLAQWRRDEAALRAHGAQSLLLVAEPTTRRERERAGWLSSLCTRVDALTAAGSLDLYGGRKRYLFFSGIAKGVAPSQAPATPGDCPATAIR